MKSIKEIQQYVKHYNELDLLDKIKFVGKKIGTKVVSSVLIMVILISDTKIPLKVRLVFMAAIGYLILPTDLVADLLPAIGFADDIAFLTYAISRAREYITPEVKDKAKQKLGQWISEDVEDAEIVDV